MKMREWVEKYKPVFNHYSKNKAVISTGDKNSELEKLEDFEVLNENYNWVTLYRKNKD